MRVAWTPEAEAEARAITLEIAASSPAQARRVRLALSIGAERISDFPRIGMAMGSDRVRVLRPGKTALRILYRIDGDRATIIGVLWGN